MDTGTGASALPGSSPQSAPARLYGLESLRLVLAVWVALGHGAWISLPKVLGVESGVAKMAATAPAFMFCGTFAVAIFFMLSGLCIHYPNVGKDRISWGNFFLGRIARIGLPLIIVWAICLILGETYVLSLDAVVWSVYCEIIYYILYPVTFLILKKYSKLFIAVSLAVSSLILAIYFNRLRLWELGSLTWLYCYPMWIAGAILAIKLRSIGLPRPSNTIWVWRGAAVGACILAVAAISQSRPPIGYNVTIVPFALFSYYWLSKEIGTLAERRPSAWLEHLGHASYTLYLVHRPAMTFVENVFPQLLEKSGLMAVFVWILKCCAISIATTIVYFTVERPSHRLGRRLSKLGAKSL